MTRFQTIFLYAASTALIIILFIYGKRALTSGSLSSEYSYRDNPNYEVAVDLATAYGKQADIVMMGSTHSDVNWNELLNRNNIAIRAVSGDITAGYIARINQVLSVKPRLVFIEGGSNDIVVKVSEEKIMNNIITICEMLKSAGIAPVLNTVMLVGHNHPEAARINRGLAGLNTQIHNYANRKSLFCIDINSNISRDGYLLERFSQDDNIHLNSAGYKVWAKTINSMIDTINSIKYIQPKHQSPNQ